MAAAAPSARCRSRSSAFNVPQNRSYLRGVIAAGNTNFGAAYGIAGDIIAKMPGAFLYRFELLGTRKTLKTFDRE